MGAWLAILRGIRLRCPDCGRGRIFRSLFVEHRACPACGRVWQRDAGDWTGGAEIAFLLCAAILLGLLFALHRFAGLPAVAELGVLLAASVVVVPFTYRQVKGFWLGVLFAWEGPDPKPAREWAPEWFVRLWDDERDRPQWEEPEPTKVRLR
ncbi:MAG TPA: DUF983 domain-containing protein [Candidatus Thermoplasmatota archaeon]|nr:DUF983 domain-containing protein [Candidatus Thermoplasmatota archaeon]